MFYDSGTARQHTQRGMPTSMLPACFVAVLPRLRPTGRCIDGTNVAQGHISVRGFTLIEMMIALAIIAIVTAISAPSIRESLLNARMSAEASDLMANIALARAEAVKRNERVLLCVSTNYTAATPTCTGGSWSQGYIVFVDLSKGGNHNTNEPLLRVVPPFASGNTATSGGVTTIPYAPNGSPVPGTPPITVTLCDPRSGRTNAGRRITINTTGRPSLARWTC